MAECHVTIEQYHHAWLLIQGGATEQEIREACSMTARQADWVLKKGDESKDMEPLRKRLRKAQAEIRAEMLAMARAVANSGLQAINKQFINANNASAMVAWCLNKLNEHATEGTEPPAWVLKTLGELRHHADTSKAAVSFRTLFGDTPAHAQSPSERTPGLNGRRPAALESGDDDNATGLELAQHMSNWSDEDLDHYINTGEEPDRRKPEDPIDVEVVES
jgi:hypothetical protein